MPAALPLIDPLEGARLCGNNAMLYLRLLRCFPGDKSAQQLKAAIQSGDRENAYLYAHTLKGLSAQLALPALSKECAKLCDLLRDEDTASLTALHVQTAAVLQCHAQTIEAIDALHRKCSPP